LFRKILLLAMAAVISLSLLSCQKDNKPEESPENSPAASEKPPENIPVAVVNDTEIMLFDLFEMYQNLNRNYMQQGIDITDEETSNQILEEAVNTLIAYELLYQNAVKEGYKISNDELNTELDAFKSQFESEEEFLNSLEMQQTTLDEFKNELERELTVSNYVQNTVEQPEVTEDEMLEMYEQYIKETTEENPPEYEELKSRIEQKIRDNKFSQKVDELIETLKDQSKVEIFREEMEKE
jgi:hypothetical protein